MDDALNLAMSMLMQRASDLAEDVLLREYVDRISDLLLRDNLRQSQPEDEVRTVARSRTLLTLRLLHGERKAHLLQFLYDSRLIIPDALYVTLFEAALTGANLAGVDLTCAQLVGANLSRANLSRANLDTTNLRQADLTGADLTEANLSGADLTMAKLTGATLARAGLRMTKLRAIYDRTTIWPDGFDPQVAEAKKQDMS